MTKRYLAEEIVAFCERIIDAHDVGDHVEVARISEELHSLLESTFIGEPIERTLRKQMLNFKSNATDFLDPDELVPLPPANIPYTIAFELVTKRDIHVVPQPAWNWWANRFQEVQPNWLKYARKTVT